MNNNIDLSEEEIVHVPKKPLLTKSVILFLLSQNLSLFGSSVVGFAIIWYITLQTSSGIYLMFATLAQMVPFLIVSLYSGVWADRYDRKILIMISDAFIALATLLLALLFSLGYDSIWAILTVSVIRSIGSGVQSPAVNAIIPQLVDSEHLVRIQGINQSLNSALMLLSPAVGGMMLGLFSLGATLYLDVVTAALAVGVFSFIKVEKRVAHSNEQSMFQDIKSGMAYTFTNPMLRNLLICYGFSFFLITPAAILTPLLVERTFGSDVWRLTANEMVWTAGSLLGGLLVSLKGTFSNKVRAIALSLVAFGLCFALLGLAPTFLIYLIIMGIGGVFVPVFNTAEIVMIQEIADEAMMGRVFSIVQLLSGSAIPLGILFFGPLADRVSVQSILVVSGILLAVVGIVYAKSTSSKQLLK
ncbi:MAG: MFS transporter [Spirochaetia bacterium]|nr:MFS transporter [Spirochaetia bacterium]